MWWKEISKTIFSPQNSTICLSESENIMTEYSFITFCILTKFHANFYSSVLGKVMNPWWYPSSPHFLSLVLSNPPLLVGIQVLQVHIIIIIISALLWKAPQMWPTAFNGQESRRESSTGEKNGLPQYTQATHILWQFVQKECGQEIAKPTHSHCSCSITPTLNKLCDLHVNKGCVTLWPCHLQ